ncbi:hypothetical protein FBY10_12053 [Pseudomonas sp. SJZ103]|nr:hypothetical protein [Pseudomonas sp. SJZ073]MBB6315541.1 hypothetical protein [Pseudomonas sp. JAI120]TWC61562.1 hypothetical protein FBY10_12053 [Pseudomonas sp. SJZ103]TWC78758.1 hypothetical protein FBY08_12153 [Pseudomonas sp. SJZ094]
MKTIISTSVLLLSIMVFAAAVNEIRIANPQAAINNCKMNPLQCVTPSVSFASLR